VLVEICGGFATSTDGSGRFDGAEGLECVENGLAGLKVFADAEKGFVEGELGASFAPKSLSPISVEVVGFVCPWDGTLFVPA
jgi:hypothetical protein